MSKILSDVQRRNPQFTKHLCWIFICCLSPVLCLAAQQQQIPNPPPQPSVGPVHGIGDRVEALHIEGLDEAGALHDIAKKANAVIGVDAVRSERSATRQNIVFDFPGGTVTSLLNMFVAHAPDYRWQDDGGIIHVFRNGAQVSLADVVMSYPGADDKTRMQIWLDLHERPEVRAWMQSNQCRTADHFQSMNFVHRRGLPFSISIAPGTMTVAHLLDEIALKTGVNYWAVLQTPPSSKACGTWITVW